MDVKIGRRLLSDLIEESEKVWILYRESVGNIDEIPITFPIKQTMKENSLFHFPTPV